MRYLMFVATDPDGEHPARALGQPVLGRHPEWDARVRDLAFGPEQAL